MAFSRTRTRLVVLASEAFLSHMPVCYSHYQGMELWRQLQHMCEDEGQWMGELRVPVAGAIGGGGSGRRGGGGDAAVGDREAGGGDDVVTYRCDVFAA